MTIAELIDYLQQFPPDTRVFLSENDVETPGEFITLDHLDYSDETS